MRVYKKSTLDRVSEIVKNILAGFVVYVVSGYFLKPSGAAIVAILLVVVLVAVSLIRPTVHFELDNSILRCYIRNKLIEECNVKKVRIEQDIASLKKKRNLELIMGEELINCNSLGAKEFDYLCTDIVAAKKDADVDFKNWDEF